MQTTNSSPKKKLTVLGGRVDNPSHNYVWRELSVPNGIPLSFGSLSSLGTFEHSRRTVASRRKMYPFHCHAGRWRLPEPGTGKSGVVRESSECDLENVTNVNAAQFISVMFFFASVSRAIFWDVIFRVPNSQALKLFAQTH